MRIRVKASELHVYIETVRELICDARERGQRLPEFSLEGSVEFVYLPAVGTSERVLVLKPGPSLQRLKVALIAANGNREVIGNTH